MATGLPSDGSVVSGCRAGTDRFLYIDVAAAIRDGIDFWRSGNDVILTSGKDGVLDRKYIVGAHNSNGQVLFGAIPGRIPAEEKARRVPGLDNSQQAKAPQSEKIVVDAAPKVASVLTKSEKNFLK